MTLKLGSRLKWSGSLVASALLLASTTASAQMPPPDTSVPPPADGASPAPSITMPANPSEPTTTEGESYPRMGKSHEIMVAKDIWLRFGVQLQVWYDGVTSNNPNITGLQNNIFLRRGRLLTSAQLSKNFNVFFQLDAPRLGQLLPNTVTTVAVNDMGAPVLGTTSNANNKRFNTTDGGGLIIQDAFGEFKFAGDALMMEAGLMVVPFARQELNSTTSFIALDLTNTAGLIPFSSATRDIGFQLKGYELDDHLEFRLGIFSGNRQFTAATAAPPATVQVNNNGHNFFRVAGYAMYNFLDTEKGYVYAGQYWGKKKILAVSAGFDFADNDQNGAAADPAAYWAASGSVNGSIPLSGEASKTGGDEIAFQLMYFHWDAGQTGPATAARQNDFDGEVTYYNNDLHVGVFGKFEYQKFDEDTLKANNNYIIQGGLKYFVWDNFMNFTLAYTRQQFPDADGNVKRGTNDITFQTQFFYY